ncbi:hypothetical protein LENED_004954 [Lentinula edodes]|uniref:Uncharacterized protein n=1 Tax=Lentinula edodes TaxID=5353 RepID=A0A1Q3E7N1_LENED|nr:hypothetical protein LENED_004954 [Lentinula edodes]
MDTPPASLQNTSIPDGRSCGLYGRARSETVKVSGAPLMLPHVNHRERHGLSYCQLSIEKANKVNRFSISTLGTQYLSTRVLPMKIYSFSAV